MVQFDSTNPDGGYTADIAFKAFIPNTLGFNVYGSPMFNVRWGFVPGPGNLLSPPMGKFYAFATNDRALPGTAGTSRLSLSMKINARSAGHLRGQLSVAVAGTSHEILVFDSTPKALQQNWTYVPGSAQRPKTTTVDHRLDEIYNQYSSTGRETIIDARASAGYPFSTFSFAIDLDLHVVIKTDSRGEHGTIDVTATSNSFPAYELFINDLVDWKMPNDRGPGFNLAGTGSQTLRGNKAF